jgi:hypothetical protein
MKLSATAKEAVADVQVEPWATSQGESASEMEAGVD